jgi:iron-sulfur cluster assembly protein
LRLSALARGDGIVLPRNGFDVVVDRQSAEIVDGLRVDYVDSGALEGFLLTARAPGPPIEDWAAQTPSGQPFGPPELVSRVHEALDRVRPLLQADGGDVVLLGIRDGATYVRLTGACSGCSTADQTLANVVEHAVRTGAGEITHTVLMP